jgi:hypothetical protein
MTGSDKLSIHCFDQRENISSVNFSGHVLFDRGRRGLALKRLDICGDRDRFNVFEVLIPGALDPGQELLDRPVIGCSCVRVADWDRKKLEELFPG